MISSDSLHSNLCKERLIIIDFTAVKYKINLTGKNREFKLFFNMFFNINKRMQKRYYRVLYHTIQQFYGKVEMEVINIYFFAGVLSKVEF